MKRISTLCLLVYGACGGGNRGGSGVDGSLIISDLTQAEKSVVCSGRIRHSYKSVSVKDICTYEAVFSTTSLIECRAYVEACEETLNEELADERAGDLEYCETYSWDWDELSCDHTVEEYETCYKMDDAAFAAYLRKLSCRDAGEVGDEDYDHPEGCREILGRCYIY